MVSFSPREGLAGDTVLGLFEDREGSMWVGPTVGLTRISMSKPSQVAALPQFENKQVRAIVFARSGDAWVGTADGLYRMSGGRLRRYDQRDGLPGRTVAALHIAPDGTLWAVTENGVARFAGERFTPVVQTLPPLRRVVAISSDRDGRLWLCDVTGLYTLDRGTLTALNVNTHAATAAFTDSRGRVWVGFTVGGVVMFEHGTSKQYSTGDGLPESIVSGIQEDGGGDIWVTTTAGLAWFDGTRFHSLTRRNGLPDDAITARVEDGNRNVWLGTGAGIIRISPEQLARGVASGAHRLQYRVLDASDGFATLQWAGAPTAGKAPDGSLWFVARNGIIVVNPNRVGDVPAALPVRIERFVADGRTYTSDLALPPSTRQLEVDYTALSFAAPSKLRFRYMLDGFDRDWVLADTRRQAFYTNLAAGTYRFRVSASNVGGEWNEPADLQFTVSPAFYQTRLFYVLSALLLSAALIAGWRYRIHRLRQKYAIVLAERARVGREIHDTLLQGMVGVALQLQGSTESPDLGPVSKQRLERARDYLEHYIRETRRSIWALRSAALDQPDFAAAIEHMARALMTDDRIAFRVTVRGGPIRLEAQTEEHLLRIAHEAISNALRHATPRRIDVDLDYAAGSWTMRISDDGVGFEVATVAAKDGHWGLRTMRERAEVIAATLRIESGPAGTSVTVGGTSA
jgi:signal transduction histidine kinase